MGGGITGRLLASNPSRFITAGFGGSGIRETDPELQTRAEVMEITRGLSQALEQNLPAVASG